MNELTTASTQTVALRPAPRARVSYTRHLLSLALHESREAVGIAEPKTWGWGVAFYVVGVALSAIRSEPDWSDLAWGALMLPVLWLIHFLRYFCYTTPKGMLSRKQVQIDEERMAHESERAALWTQVEQLQRKLDERPLSGLPLRDVLDTFIAEGVVLSNRMNRTDIGAFGECTDWMERLFAFVGKNFGVERYDEISKNGGSAEKFTASIAESEIWSPEQKCTMMNDRVWTRVLKLKKWREEIR